MIFKLNLYLTTAALIIIFAHKSHSCGGIKPVNYKHVAGAFIAPLCNPPPVHCTCCEYFLFQDLWACGGWVSCINICSCALSPLGNQRGFVFGAQGSLQQQTGGDTAQSLCLTGGFASTVSCIYMSPPGSAALYSCSPIPWISKGIFPFMPIFDAEVFRHHAETLYTDHTPFDFAVTLIKLTRALNWLLMSNLFANTLWSCVLWGCSHTTAGHS